MHLYVCHSHIAVSTSLVWIQTRENSAIVAKFKRSKLLQALLELGVVASVILGPGIILWVPYNEDLYGFDGEICGLKKSSNTSKVTGKETIIVSFFKLAEIEPTGLVALITAIVMAMVYCCLSNKLPPCHKEHHHSAPWSAYLCRGTQ